jgi:hypothetical protein
MKNRSTRLLAAAIFLLMTISTRAQGRFEASPFVGYETSGSYPVNTFSNLGAPTPVNELRVNGSLAFGTFLDYNLTEDSQLEFMWNRNNTSFSARDILTGNFYKAFNSTIDQFQFGTLYTFLNSEHRLRPYVAGSLGFTHYSNSNATPNQTEFSFSIGGGVKYYVNRHVGLRGDMRYLPTYGSSSNAIYCDPFFGCYSARVANYLNRGSFVGGLIFRF